MMKKIFFSFLCIFFVTCVFVVQYAKANIPHLSIEEFEEYKIVSKIEYEQRYETQTLFVDEKVKTVEDLSNLSDYIVVVTVLEKRFAGNGMINLCNIDKVWKGETLKEGEEIKVYDLASQTYLTTSNYLGGSVPLKPGNQYILFLKKTERANIKNSYVPISVYYGIVTTGEIKILENYKERLSIQEIYSYQHVFDQETKKPENYEDFIGQIQKQYQTF